MGRRNLFCVAALVMTCTMTAPVANAEPGDAKAVAKARKDYADAMRGHDIGLQNAMRVELSYQLSKARERTGHKSTTSGARPRRDDPN